MTGSRDERASDADAILARPERVSPTAGGVDAGAGDGVAADGPALAVAAVARRLGVAPATLRTWDRRYGLGPSEHSAGAHRRYSPQDVERLVVMRRLTLEGVAPGEAARAALSGAALPGPGLAAVTHAPAVVTVSMVVDAAMVDDAAACGRLLAMDPGGDVTRWWTDLVAPVLEALARRTVLDRPGADAARSVEHAALDALRARTGPRSARPAPVVLVLCPVGVSRPLVAHVLAAALAAEGLDARIVGGPTGERQVLELVAMTRPRAVVTVAPRTARDVAAVARVGAEHADVPQFVMSADVADLVIPVGASIHRARTLQGLVPEVLAVASAGSTPEAIRP